MTLLYVTVISVILGASLQQEFEVFSDSTIWGPGLEPDRLVLPARYLFLQVSGNYSVYVYVIATISLYRNNWLNYCIFPSKAWSSLSFDISIIFDGLVQLAIALLIQPAEILGRWIYTAIIPASATRSSYETCCCFRISGDSQVKFKVTGNTLDKGRPCRAWSNVLDRKDGSFILRYKMYEPCKDLEIHVEHNDVHLGDSPYIVSGIVYPENCVCPIGDVKKWISRAECGKVPDQIQADLKQFKEVNWNEIRNKVIKRFNKPESVSICHYVIKNNEIYRRCYGKYVGFKMFMDSILLSLTRKMVLPDMEFFSNLGDWPLVKKDSELVPVFSWCGSEETFDIVMPTYDITESTIENMGRVMLDMLSVQGNTHEPWERRVPKVFWRGRDSNLERLKLIDISRKHPDLFNVSMTNFFFYRDQQEKYGPKAEHVSFYTFFDYKYQVSIDGTVAAYRVPYLLAGGSLIFKQNSKYYEHFYSDISPGIHYVPIEHDLSDLIDKIYWAISNEDAAKAIADNAKVYANNNLLPKDIFCYHAFLLSEFAKLIKSEVRVLKGMEKVVQPEEARNCNCHNYMKDEL